MDKNILLVLLPVGAIEAGAALSLSIAADCR